MKEIKFTVRAFFTAFLAVGAMSLSGCVPASPLNKSLSDSVSIIQGEREIKLSENSYAFMDSEIFTIRFYGINKNQGVKIFAYFDDSHMNKYTFPVKTIETDMFDDAMCMAEYPLNPETGYTLSVHEAYGVHYIGEDRRINYENYAELPVTAISDATGKLKEKIYLSFFVDYNNDKSVSENEYAAIELIMPHDFNKTVTHVSEEDFAENKRAYFHSAGFRAKRENYAGRRFIMYKIKSHSDFERICEIEKDTFISKPLPDYFGFMMEDKNLTEPRLLLLAPKGISFSNNPFRLRGDSTVYFEAVDEESGNSPVSIRSLFYKDSYDKIAVYYKGKIILMTPQFIQE